MKGKITIEIVTGRELTSAEKEKAKAKLTQYIGYVNECLLNTVTGIEREPLRIIWEEQNA